MADTECSGRPFSESTLSPDFSPDLPAGMPGVTACTTTGVGCIRGTMPSVPIEKSSGFRGEVNVLYGSVSPPVRFESLCQPAGVDRKAFAFFEGWHSV